MSEPAAGQSANGSVTDPERHPSARPPRVFAALVLLTFGSGVTDPFAFLGLGGTFTANMTGNLVLVGLVGRPDYPRAALLAGVAIAAFALSLLVSFRVFRNVA